MMKNFDRKLVLEDGSEYYGYAYGGKVLGKVCEIVFNTSMVGYQEIVSDPSYTYQIVVMTYPLIGNYGIADEDFESKTPTMGGLIVREYNDQPSNFRYSKTLSDVLEENGIPGITGVDTRKLARHIRDNGSCKAMITDAATPNADAVAAIIATDIPRDAVKLVSCKKKIYARTANHKYTIAVIDCGMKLNIVRSLCERGCNAVILPYDTTAEEVIALKPDGIFISNGPGDPEDVKPVIELIKNLRGKYPICGICLGLQLIAIAYGAKTYKLKFGHRGANHPIKNVATGKIEITSQNHSYAVDKASLEGTGLEITHINLLDDTVEGIACTKDMIFGAQYHPESAPGPRDSTLLFDHFTDMIKEVKENA